MSMWKDWTMRQVSVRVDIVILEHLGMARHKLRRRMSFAEDRHFDGVHPELVEGLSVTVHFAEVTRTS